MDLSTTVVPRFILRFYNGANGIIQAHAARWSLIKLIEYVDNDGVAGFQAGGNDTIARQYSLLDPLAIANRRWSSWSRSTNSSTGVHRICSTLTVNSTNFTIDLCATVCPKSTIQDRTGPGAACGRPRRTCRPGGLKWSFRINNFPWSTTTSGIALKVVFDTRNAIREIRRNGTKLANEGDPDPREPIVASPTNEDDNDSVNDLGDSNTATWERTVDVSGGTCAACSTAEVVREVFNSGEFTRDIDNIGTTFGGLTAESLGSVTRTFRVTYLSMITSCKPTVIFWDPSLVNDNANAALGLVPSLGLLGALVALLF
jgi:hypothetical protein